MGIRITCGLFTNQTWDQFPRSDSVWNLRSSCWAVLPAAERKTHSALCVQVCFTQTVSEWKQWLEMKLIHTTSAHYRHTTGCVCVSHTCVKRLIFRSLRHSFSSRQHSRQTNSPFFFVVVFLNLDLHFFLPEVFLSHISGSCLSSPNSQSDSDSIYHLSSWGFHKLVQSLFRCAVHFSLRH